jgi:hypothetical protein
MPCLSSLLAPPKPTRATTPNAPPLHAAACRPAGPRGPLHDPTGHNARLQDRTTFPRNAAAVFTELLLTASARLLVDEITGLPCPGATTVTHTGSYRARARALPRIN